MIPTHSSFQAVIFDMDGLLLDTETLAMASFMATCKDYQRTVAETTYHRCLGTNSAGTEKILKEVFGQDFPIPQFFKDWSAHFRRYAADKPIPVKSGAIDLLEALKAENKACAVATSTSKPSAERHLEESKLRQYFRDIACGSEVQHGKPAPDVYLLAAERLGIDPRHCLALEDSDNGVRAATAAGMTVIQVPDMVQPSAEFRQNGHTVCPSLTEVKALLFP